MKGMSKKYKNKYKMKGISIEITSRRTERKDILIVENERNK